MEFRLLGPIAATVEGRTVELGRRRERCLLALLLLDAGRPVPVDRLIDLLWGDDAPAEPRRALSVHVSRLRRSLTEADGSVLLTGDGGGYTLHVDAETVDVHRFTALVGRARQHTDPTERARLLREALDPWHGPAMPELTGERCQPLRTRLDELRADTTELRVEADLDAGHHHELLAELASLTTEHPARDRLVRARLLALYRAGRKSEALQEYERTAQRLADDFGVDPGPDLRALHTAILRDDPALDAPTGPPPAAPVETVREALHHASLTVPVREATAPPNATTPDTAAPPTSDGTDAPTTDGTPQDTTRVLPAELPAGIPTFAGRDDELAEIVASSRQGREAPPVTAIDGMAGVGKTALAVRAAHRLSERYPDGQVYLDLHGHTAGVEPATAAEALERLLSSFGVTGAQVPADLTGRAALYRSVVAERQLLLVLDNAVSVEQVAPLLPGTAGCLVLLTSRQRLTGIDQARHLSLTVLPHAQAVTLFTRIVGQERVAAEPLDQLDEVVEACGGLPLALRIAATRLHSRPSWSVSHLLDRLRDERRRLAELQVGERSVAGAFRLSYQQLDDEYRRMFRLVGLHAGPDFDAAAAAALTDGTAESASSVLDGLLDVHLLEQHVPDRYRFHDLLREYAVERAVAEEPEADRRAASTRLLDWYLHTTTAASDALEPGRFHPMLGASSCRTPVPAFTGFDDAIGWFAAEHRNLAASVQRAASAGLHRHCWQLAHGVYRYFYLRSLLGDWFTTHETALRSTRLLGDRHGEAETLTHLATAYGRTGRVSDAIEHLVQALPLYRDLGDRAGEAAALNNLGGAHMFAGHPDVAVRCLEAALTLRRALGDERGEAVVLNNLGKSRTHMGQLPGALTDLRRALTLHRRSSAMRAAANTLTNLGLVYVRNAAYDDARSCGEEALAIATRVGDHDGVADAHNLLGELHHQLGDHARARKEHEQALTLSRQISQPVLEAEALNGLGNCCLATGGHAEALDHHERALAIAERFGGGLVEAAAHHGLGRALLAAGNRPLAADHLNRALAAFTELHAPEADHVRTELTATTAEVTPQLP